MIAFLSYHAGQHLIFIAMLVIHVTMHWVGRIDGHS